MEETFNENQHWTAKKAVKILIDKYRGFKEPTKKERENISMAFAKKNKVLYGRAFDIVKVKGKDINLEKFEDVVSNLDRITIYEVKSTSRDNIDKKFKNYFFALTTAELLIAQSLKDHFKFIFVNTKTGDDLVLTLNEIFKKSRGIYPSWSIRF